MLALTVPSAALFGVMAAVLNAGCFGLVSSMPPLYAQALMTGQAVAGLAVSVASFVTTAAEPPGASVRCRGPSTAGLAIFAL